MILNNYKIIWEKLTTSLWFLPALISFIGITLAIFIFYIDKQTSANEYGVWLLSFDIGISDIRQVIAITTSSVITVTGVVFSMTMVALTLASNQFGPKILRNFLKDSSHKWTLGILLATFFYGVVILSLLDGKGDDYRPLFTALTNLVITIVAISSLIIFIHRVTKSIQADHIIALIGEDIERALNEIETDATHGQVVHNEEMWKTQIEPSEQYPIRSNSHGYIQSIDWDNLIKLALDNDICLDFGTRPGKFVLDGEQLGAVYSCQKQDSIPYDEILSCISIDKKRSPVEDLEYSLDQLVQVALRALSPGVNDSVTALTCIDWLSVAISRMAKATFPPTYKLDDDNHIRVKAKTFSFESAVETAFNPIRQNTRNNEMVLIYLIETLTDLIDVAKHPKYYEILSWQIEALCENYDAEKLPKVDKLKYNETILVYNNLMQEKSKQD